MPADKITRRDDQVRFTGRILFLTEDTSLIRRQLEATGDEAKTLEDELAQRLLNDNLPLTNNISTDEITPGWVCYYYDETLGQYVYVGMREGAVKKDEVKRAVSRSSSPGFPKAAGRRARPRLTPRSGPASSSSSPRASRRSTARTRRTSAF